MTKELSSSPERNTFQKEKYLQRQAEKGLTPENDEDTAKMVEYYNSWSVEADRRQKDLEWRKNNLEYDLRSTDWMVEKVRSRDSYAQNLYAAMCNNDFQRNDTWPVLKDERWHCSWRYAGGIVADMRGEGDYIDWYCSGIRNVELDDELTGEYGDKYVPESVVTEEIRADLFQLGWIVIEEDTDQ